MYYANAEQLSQEVLHLVKTAEPALSWFCIDAVAVDDIDFTAAARLHSLAAILKQRGVRLVFVELADNVRVELHRYGLTGLVSPDGFYATADDLVRAYDAHAARAGRAGHAP